MEIYAEYMYVIVIVIKLLDCRKKLGSIYQFNN